MIVRATYGADMITGIDMAVNGVMGGILGAMNAANPPPPPPRPPMNYTPFLLAGGAILAVLLLKE